MRKMQEFIAKGKKIFIGLEDSKTTWKVSVRCEGEEINSTTMPAKYEVLRSYLNRYPECGISLIYEAGFQGFWLRDLLEQDGIKCKVTPPNKVPMPKDNRVKTDKRDAHRLARILENNDYVECSVPDKERRMDRQVSRVLDQMQKEIRAFKNRIRRFLDWHGLNEGLPEGDWTDKDYLDLRNLQIHPTLRTSLGSYLNILESLLAEKNQLQSELREIAKKERYQKQVDIKKKVPGIGALSAIRFTLEWGELSRFQSGKKFGSYTGLTCREYSTGETIRKGRITGQSSAQVRSWLIECAWRAKRIDPALNAAYMRIKHNTGSKKKAIVAVARKLAVRVRAVELAEQNYAIGVIK